jgi:hypothetical protein
MTMAYSILSRTPWLAARYMLTWAPSPTMRTAEKTLRLEPRVARCGSGQPCRPQAAADRPAPCSTASPSTSAKVFPDRTVIRLGAQDWDQRASHKLALSCVPRVREGGARYWRAVTRRWASRSRSTAAQAVALGNHGSVSSWSALSFG